MLAAVALAVRTDDGLRALVANLTPSPQEVAIAGIEGELAVRRLNETTAGGATADPSSFRRSAETVTASGELPLTLAAYEVVRIDARGTGG